MSSQWEEKKFKDFQATSHASFGKLTGIVPNNFLLKFPAYFSLQFPCLLEKNCIEGELMYVSSGQQQDDF